MEIPQKLKALYQHWDSHTKFRPSKSLSSTSLDQKILDEIESFAKERMLIWERKVSKTTFPYTDDQILANYRFCNLYRELDRQTIEIHEHLKPLKSDFNLWLLNLTLHRFIAKPDTIKQVGLLSFDAGKNKKVYQKLKTMKSPKYGVPYIFPISVIQKVKFNTREKFFCLYLPSIIKNIGNVIWQMNDTTVNQALEEILPIFGFNFRFHWTEILIDVAYQFPKKINLFKDFYIGPGAIPTIKRLSSEWIRLNDLVNVEFSDFPYLTYNGDPIYFSAENWEGIACEFRKYTNLKNGKGRKRKYL